MATIKLGLIFAYLIGIPLQIFAFIANIDSWKSLVIFIVAVVYWGGMIWFGFRRKIQLEKEKAIDLRLREIELWHKEHDRLEKIDSKKKKKNEENT